MATPTMGVSSVDRLARSKRPTVERTEIHIPPAPVFPLEAVTGDPRMRAQAVAAFNNALQKWRNDAWSIEAPFVPDAELQADVATLEDATAKMSTKLDRAAVDIRRSEANITTISSNITSIDNSITVIEGNAITGTGIVQANGSGPPTAIIGTAGHVPYWTSAGPPYISPTSPIYTDGTLVGIGTDLPAVLLDIGLAGVTSGVIRLAGGTSGNVTITTSATTGMWTLTLPINAGSANEFLKTNGSGVTSWSSVVLTTDVTGVLPVANGGTNATSWTAGSVIFAGAGGTSLAEDSANFFWDDTTNRLGIGTAVPGASLEIVSVTPLRLARSGLNAFTVSISGVLTGTLSGDLVWNTVQTDGGFAWRINNGSTVALAIAEGGNIGILNTNPGALLDLGLAGTTLGVMRLAGSTSGNVTIQPQATAGTWTLQLPQNDGALGEFLTTDGAGITSWSAGASVTPSALTRVDDTNITLTLGGSPTVALLAATSLTLGWTGVLSIARGGTNASSFAASTGVVYFDGTSLVNSADLFYAGSQLSSRGISLNGINEPYEARNINTGANAGTGYRAVLADTSNNVITAGYITWFKEQSWTTVAATQDASATIGTTLDGATIAALRLHSSGSVVCGKDSTLTTRTDDFLYLCSTAGLPTGVPTAFGSRIPIEFNTTSNKLAAYDSKWFQFSPYEVKAYDVADTGNVGIGEDTLRTYTIPGGTMSDNGDSIEFYAAGTFATSINSKRLRVKFGATTIFDSGALAITTTADWCLEGSIIRVSATTQRAIVTLTTSSGTLSAYADYTTPGETLSGTVDLVITGEATSNDDIVCTLEKIMYLGTA